MNKSYEQNCEKVASKSCADDSSTSHSRFEYLSISEISQLLLTWFWPNFKGRFLEPSLTDASRYGDICPVNICPGDICPYQAYLSCYWPDADDTLQVGSWEHLEQIPTVTVTFVQAIFVQATFVLVTFVHIRNISAVTDTIWTKL